mgnify:CR=1 FL=1
MKIPSIGTILAAARALTVLGLVAASGASFAAGQNQADFPNLPGTAADCLPGRHWELVPTARCVCDGDPTHKPVSNDQPAACVGVPPPPPPPPTGPVIVTTWENQTQPCPPPQTGTMWQIRQVVTTDGVAAYGAWMPNGDTCSGPVAPPPSAPVITYVPENQTLACPTGYSGSGVVQTRQVTYTDGVATAYSAWTTLSMDCNYVQPPPPPPPEPMVPVSVTICGGAYGYLTAVVPQSQVDAWYIQYSNWYFLREYFLNNGSGFDGSCGVGL